MVPADLRYTKDHEWVRVEGDEATVGITAYAADQLGDIVFVELPDAGPTGAVTSGTMSPTLGEAIAMAYVAPADAEPGTMLAVEIRGARVAAEVVPLPFYTRPT